jgi:hypothetical protein
VGLTYNGVSLSDIQSERIEQESVRDPSGTDQLFTLFRITVRAIVYPGLSPAGVGENPGDAVARVRHMLLQPRQSLTYTTPDGAVLVQAGPGNDAANGPTPIGIPVVTPVTAGSLLVDYTVECHLTDCGAAGNREFLSLRWTEVVTIDEMWRTVKQRNGTLIVRTGVDPDALRFRVTPGVPQGFRRESSRYELNETNLTVRFAFTDRELMRPPPAPALRLRGRQVESTPMPGALRHGEIMLQLDGPKGVNPREMLNAAIRIAMSRVHASGGQVGRGGRMLIGGSIAESLNDDENRVELALRWTMKPVAGRSSGRGLSDASMQTVPNVYLDGLGSGSPVFPPMPPPQPNAQGREMAALPIGYASWVGAPLPGSDPKRTIGGLTRGTAPDIRLIAAALNDPCGQTAVIQELRGGNLWAGVSEDGVMVQVVNTAGEGYGPPYYPGFADSQDALYGTDSSPGVYDHYELTAIYKDSGGNAVCPSTKEGEKAIQVKVMNSLLTMRLEWTATRTGGTPVFPSVKPTDGSNIVYLGGTIPVGHVDVGGDGVSLVYSASGIFDFAFLDASTVSIAAPVPPWLNLGAAFDEPNQMFAFAAWPFQGVADGANPFTGVGQSPPGGGGGGGGGGPPVLP